jgi:hypothetical protein
VGNNEDGDEHVQHFGLVFVMQAETHHSQRVISVAGLNVEYHPNGCLTDNPAKGCSFTYK